MEEFAGEALTMLGPDAQTAAASLIERSKPAEWTLFTSNTGDRPDWTDFSIMTAASDDANTGQCAVRESSGPGLNVKQEHFEGSLLNILQIFFLLVFFHPLKTKPNNKCVY